MSESFHVSCDNVVWGSDGKMHVHESMFSEVCDLSGDLTEVVARIHPVKRHFFDALAQGAQIEVTARNPYGGMSTVAIAREVTLHVSGPDDADHSLDYASVMASHGRSFAEVHARGFDAGAEPVLRQMPDRSFRLVFCSMPPRAHVLGPSFNMDDFGGKLLALAKGRITWDDRDVFHIASASEAEIRAILQFLLTYGRA